MEPRRDYYEILGVGRTATPEEIKRAYRRLAMRYHPDRAQGEPGAEDRFKEASEAYAALSDPQRRAEYDRFGQVKGFQGFSSFDTASIQEILADVFGDLFRSKNKARERGRDLRYDLQVSLSEVAQGSEREVRIPRKIRCTVCGGSGARPGSEQKSCQTCGGSGEMKIQKGFFTLRRSCTYCHGEGKLVVDPCRACFGSGLAEVEQVLTVRIPAGVTEGQRLRVAGKGEDGLHGGDAGDLFVHVKITPDPLFTRDGQHLRCEVPISVSEAVLGCSIPVPTLEGTVRLQVPPGTQSGTVFRLPGRGLLPLGGKEPERGHELVQVQVELPRELNAAHRQLYEQLLRLESEALPQRAAFQQAVAERGRSS